MKLSNNDFARLDLKCDFPARESFRKALLTHLHEIDEQAGDRPAPNVDEGLFDDSEARELLDSELNMLAAAQGQTIVPNNWGDNPSNPLTKQS